ncbi:putative plastid-lipid-associated protein 13 [Hibiscus syriacus]|uniref:Plastid-lipid-associated protein 13 n=1 Tax=Hibiscus syriacus TaxID=106335 RepID=A0A6A2YVN2_HIBSY|nr:putative plastid-lipid-associated protein 13 [Hibiscus syriacus]
MASLQGSFPTISAIRLSFSYSSSSSLTGVSFVGRPKRDRVSSGHRRNRREMASISMVQQTVPGGASSIYAKEMERLSPKESLLLSEFLLSLCFVFKDAGGFEALVPGKTTDLQRIDVNEMIIGLERLNPTPRPTTTFPSTLAKLSKMDLHLKDGKAKVTAHLKLLNSIESKFVLSTNASIEGPLRMKEQYVEGILESPSVVEETMPEQLKGAYIQALTTIQQLPIPVKDAVASGLRVPPSGTFQRLFMISYLDEEILITRDTAGIPAVLTRIDSPSSSMSQTFES